MNMSNTPTYIYKELKRRGVEVEIIDENHDLLRYKHNGTWHMLRNCITESLPSISLYICKKKKLSEYIAEKVGMPVPPSVIYEDEESALNFMNTHKPIVVKPTDAAHGHGVSMNVSSKSTLKKALSVAKKYSNKPPLLQKMIKGSDVRLLVIGGRFVAAVKRVPATVTGDGRRSVLELIEAENEQPYRSSTKRGRLGVIHISSAKSFLRRRFSRVPKKGETVQVLGVGNTSIGGHAEDVTTDIPPSIYKKAEQFAKELSMPVCGVDILLEENQYHFLEANACPGFGPHHHPRVGKPRYVTKLFVDMILGN